MKPSPVVSTVRVAVAIRSAALREIAER